jgi:FO synthase
MPSGLARQGPPSGGWPRWRAGELAIPFTTGILVGIGETRADRIAALEAIADVASPSRPRAGGDRPELPAQARHRHAARPAVPATTPTSEAIALARLILPPDVHLQAPPNLSDDFGALLDAGIDDWGGVSPSPPTTSTPSGRGPILDRLREVTEAAGSPWRPA